MRTTLIAPEAQVPPSETLASAPTMPPESPRKERRHQWTREEYHRMAEIGLFDETRVELLGGEIWEISPQRRPHYRTIRAVTDALEAAFGEDFDVQQQAPLGLSDDEEPEPDVSSVPGRTMTTTPRLQT